jgi:hypothetical protein
MTAVLCRLAAVGALLLVGKWIVTRQQRLTLREQSWLPEELKTASLEFAERVFYTGRPFRLYAKIDRAYRTRKGHRRKLRHHQRPWLQAQHSDSDECAVQCLCDR